jgi:hypothetical protein
MSADKKARRERKAHLRKLIRQCFRTFKETGYQNPYTKHRDAYATEDFTGWILAREPSLLAKGQSREQFASELEEVLRNIKFTDAKGRRVSMFAGFDTRPRQPTGPTSWKEFAEEVAALPEGEIADALMRKLLKCRKDAATVLADLSYVSDQMTPEDECWAKVQEGKAKAAQQFSKMDQYIASLKEAMNDSESPERGEE